MKLIVMPVARLNPEDLNTSAQNLIQKLADNAADFAAAPVADLTTHRGQLNTQLGELATLEAQVKAKRLQIDATAATVRTDMNELAEWGENHTQDPVKLAKVFQLRAARTPSGPTPRVVNLTLTHGDSAGPVDAGWDSLIASGVKSCEVQTVLNPLNNDPSVGPWTQQPTVTRSTCTLGGFTSGARIWVRARGIGPSGAGDWSDPATIQEPKRSAISCSTA